MCMDHFEALGPEEMFPIELDTYTTRLRFHHRDLNEIRGRSSAFKDGHVTVHLVDPALTKRSPGAESWCYDKSVRLIML
jgi:hypothetical protein